MKFIQNQYWVIMDAAGQVLASPGPGKAAAGNEIQECTDGERRQKNGRSSSGMPAMEDESMTPCSPSA